jgi:hypothetical protein
MSIKRPREITLLLDDPYHLAWIGQFTLVCIWTCRKSNLSCLPRDLLKIICRMVYANPQIEEFKPFEEFRGFYNDNGMKLLLITQVPYVSCKFCGRRYLRGSSCTYHN